MKNSKFSFTLIELLVVIGIIATLVTLIFPFLQKGNISARRTTSNSNMNQLIKGILTQQNQNRVNKFSGVYAGNVQTTGYEKMASQTGATMTLDYANGHLPALVKVNDVYLTPGSDTEKVISSSNTVSIFQDFYGKHPFDQEMGFYGFRGSYSENAGASRANRRKERMDEDTRILGEAYLREAGDGRFAIGFADGHVELAEEVGFIIGDAENGSEPVEFMDSFHYEIDGSGKLLLDVLGSWGMDEDVLQPTNTDRPLY